jgi:non-specific serine/threonine protein kinase
LGEQLRAVQSAHGLAVDEVVLRSSQHTAHRTSPQPATQASPRRDRGGLPLELNTFVGRRSELAEVRRLFATSRLVTLTGIGGVGKTRLAMRAAAELAADFPDGVRFVELVA